MSETKPAAPTDTQKILHRLDALTQAHRRTHVATLTATLLANRRGALSIAKLQEITRDVEFAYYPQPNNPDYQEWQKTKDEKLAYVHK